MDKNEIKKFLYRNKPDAIFMFATKTGLIYNCNVDGQTISFQVPLNDIGDGLFSASIQAQLLIRYII